MLLKDLHNPFDFSSMGELEPVALNRLTEIRVPTLLVMGDREVSDVYAIAHLIQSSIPGTQKLILSNTAHFPMLEQPQCLTELFSTS